MSTQESSTESTTIDLSNHAYLHKPWAWKLSETKDENSNRDLEKFVDELIGDVKQAIERKKVNPEDLTIITENDYQNLSKANFEKEIQKWVEMVKNNKVTMSEVPKAILMEVKARI